MRQAHAAVTNSPAGLECGTPGLRSKTGLSNLAVLMLLLLPLLFLFTALLYASVGFGGGSTYTALLVLSDTDYRLVPILSLACNILVVSGNCWRYHRAGVLPVRALLPAMLVSIPMAWLGGLLPVSEAVFVSLLGLALLGAGIAMMLRPQFPGAKPIIAQAWLYPAGGLTGFLAGIVGIGGGIFLAPLLYAMKWGEEQRIAAASSLFILVNSIAGLSGQLMRAQAEPLGHWDWTYALLAPAVLLGGWMGNRVGLTLLTPAQLRLGTALLILFVAIRLLHRALFGGA